jgi:hypothetical protein
VVLERGGFADIIEEKLMLTITVATVIALSLAGMVLMKSRSTDSAQLEQPRPALLTMGVQIICGDCSGEDQHPIKTYMNRYGCCSQCGGASYLLASAVAANTLMARAMRLREAQIASSHGRVIPFEMPGSRTLRSEKIAV